MLLLGDVMRLLTTPPPLMPYRQPALRRYVFCHRSPEAVKPPRIEQPNIGNSCKKNLDPKSRSSELAFVAAYTCFSCYS